MALTRITKGVIKPNENYDTHNINSTGIVTAIGLDVNGNGDISGNLNVGGVLTYEDVTSIDSVGIITAQKDIHVGAGVSAVGVGTFGSLDIGGDIDVDGHTNLDNVSIAGVTTMTGALKISSTTDQMLELNSSDNNGTSLAFLRNSSRQGYIGYGGASNGFIIANETNNGGIAIQGKDGGSVINMLSFNTANGGVATLHGGATIPLDLDVDGHTNLDNVSITGVTTHHDDVAIKSSNPLILSNAGNSASCQVLCDGGARLHLKSYNQTMATFENGQATIFYTDSGQNRLQINNNGNVSIAKDLDVDGHTNLDNVSIAGVSTVTNFLQVFGQAGTSDKGFEVRANSTQNTDTNKAIRIRNNSNTDTFNISYKGKVTATELDISGNIDVDGHTNLDNVSIAGVTTTSGNLIANHSNGQVYLKPSDGSIEITRTGSGAYIDFKNSTSEDYDARINEEGGHIRVNTNFRLYDNKALELGNRTSSTYGDLRLFHDASDSYIENHTGVFYIQNTGDLRIRVDNTDAAIHCVRNGAVELHHAGNKKFETSSTGITVTGNINATGGQLTLETGNEQQIHRFWDSNTDSDINGLLQNYASSSTFGTVVEGAHNGHHVIALRDNDNHDSFAIISGSSNYQSDTTYDKIIARFKADGKIIFGGNTTNENVTLEILPGGTAGNYSQLVLGRTSSAPTVQTTAVVKGGNAISGVPGIIFGSANTNLPCVSVETPNSTNGHIVFKPKGSEKLRIESDGTIIMGDAGSISGSGVLHLYQASNDPYILIQRGVGDTGIDLGGLYFKNNTNSQAMIKAYQANVNTCNLHFYTNYAGTFSDRFLMESTGTFICKTTAAEEKIVLSGTSNPYIRWREQNTNRAYVQWNATANCLDLMNQEDGSGLRIKDALQFTQDGSTYYNVAHTGNYISHGENYTQYFVGTNTNTQSVIDEQKVRFYKVSIDGVSNYGGVNYVDIVRSGVHDNNGLHGMWVGSMDVRIKCRFSNCGNGSAYGRFVHNYHANTGSVTQGQGGGNIARIDTYLACTESSRLYVWLRGQLTYYIRVNGRPANIYAIDMNDYRTTMHSSVMPAGFDGESRDALSIYWGYQGQSGAGRKLYGTSGGVEAQGNVSATGSKPFKIPHPLVGLSTTKNLVHAAIEGPQCDNIYRGKTTLVAGISTVNIDTNAGMTDGTFATLNRDVQCFTTNETGWTPIKGSVSGNQLTILAQDSSCTDTISWMVVGERQDDNIINNTMTDSQGHLIVEPDFEEIVEPDDPGTFAAGSSQIGEDGSDQTFTQPLSS